MVGWPRVLLSVILIYSTAANADRYFTWVDENGQVRSTVVRENNPLKARAEEAQQEDEQRAAQPGEGQDSDKPPMGVGTLPQQVAEDPDATASSNVQALPEAAPPLLKAAPSLELDPVHDEPNTAVGPPPEAGSVPEDGAGREVEDPVFNLSNFPDANQLEERGYLREGEASPFYTWTDATGRVHNTPFNPAKEPNHSRQKERAQGSQRRPGNDSDFSQALTLRRDVGLPRDADRHAAAVLGLGTDESATIGDFSQRCCESIEKSSIRRLDPGRNESLRIRPDGPVFDFATGRSPYLVVELPNREGVFPVRLRSFVKDGVFLPTLIFLNAQWQPVRMVTDIHFDYEPESWYRLGYLQARISVEPKKGERWMLILSKGSDLSGAAVEVAGQERPTVLKPSRSGELELVLGRLPVP